MINFVVTPEANEGESVRNEHGLDLFVKHARAAKRWEAVNLENPGFELLVENDIETKHLKAASLSIAALFQFWNNCWLSADESLVYHISATIEKSLASGEVEVFD